MGGVRAGTGEMIQTEQPNEGVPGTLMGTAISLPWAALESGRAKTRVVCLPVILY